MKKTLTTIKVIFTTIEGAISAKLGILGPVLMILAFMMILDYITGMLASKQEAIEHPGDKQFGWSSKKGAQGIIKKVGYLCVIAVAMVFDYIVLHVASTMGLTISTKAFFALLVAVWYVLNELLSSIENVGRMGATVPEWLLKYIAVLKDKIDHKASGDEEE